jgi:hypothetical protein
MYILRATRLLCYCFLFTLLEASIDDRVLICGICRNIEPAVANTIFSAEALGKEFSDYRVIIYENNSTDLTPKLLSDWAQKNSKVILKSEKVSNTVLKNDSFMKLKTRTEVLARARNIVLDIAMNREFDGYKYIVWADLDFLEPWDVEHILETIQSPKEEWDAVFAYGGYDLFALRSDKWPIGFELLGDSYWKKCEEIRKEFILAPDGAWEKVYSAFGGLGIYKRDSLKGCRYSGVITTDLQKLMISWLSEAREKKEITLLSDYEEMLKKTTIIELKEPLLDLKKRKKYPNDLGLKIGPIVWFSCTEKTRYPSTCEHIPLHASMILQGKDRLFVNPKLRSNHP